MGLSARAWLPMLFAPLVAILLPAQTNFEHQNMNALLLALLAGATWQLTLGSTVIAGVLIGTATALKAFPALLILYLAARRYWAAAIAATVSAFVLSVVLPLAVYGDGFPPLAQDFWRLGNSGWPVRGNNQSLIAAIDRMALGFSATGFDRAGVRVAGDAPTSILFFAGLAVLLATTLIVILVRTTRRQTMIPCELAAVTVLAILLSPIAWDHYWTLMFPAFLILYETEMSDGPAAWAASRSGQPRFSQPVCRR